MDNGTPTDYKMLYENSLKIIDYLNKVIEEKNKYKYQYDVVHGGYSVSAYENIKIIKNIVGEMKL